MVSRVQLHIFPNEKDPRVPLAFSQRMRDLYGGHRLTPVKHVRLPLRKQAVWYPVITATVHKMAEIRHTVTLELGKGMIGLVSFRLYANSCRKWQQTAAYLFLMKKSKTWPSGAVGPASGPPEHAPGLHLGCLAPFGSSRKWEHRGWLSVIDRRWTAALLSSGGGC